MRVQNVITVSSHTNKRPPAGSPSDPHHHQCRYTTTPSSAGMSLNSTHRQQRLQPSPLLISQIMTPQTLITHTGQSNRPTRTSLRDTP
jgi:hypothetical protein